LTAPQPIERLEAVRLLAPLAILGFLSSRLMHVEWWLTGAGFVVPDLGRDDYRQPLYLAPLPAWLAFAIAFGTVASGLATSLGYKTRIASGVFAALLAYLALADRLEAFTVSKLGTVVAVALFASPSGARYGIDARKRGADAPPPTHVPWGSVRFFQVLLACMYCASGIAKARGGWVTNPDVIWTHLHDSYQTAFTYFMARAVPGIGWSIFQYTTLVYEMGAPFWFSFPRTRLPALLVGLGMHATIGLMFGPVIWFSLLMIGLLLSSFAPLGWLVSALGWIWREPTRAEPEPAPTATRGRPPGERCRRASV
jgi:uncharacterized membrane protein YphA (DoxX/SURF4 family)